MNAGDEVKGGISTERFWERESGGVHHIAAILTELESSVETAAAEWEYAKGPEELELRRRILHLKEYLDTLSILPDGSLTRWRECDRCSGAGAWHNENPCTECGGKGAIKLEIEPPAAHDG